jgi:hypothetical protein
LLNSGCALEVRLVYVKLLGEFLDSGQCLRGDCGWELAGGWKLENKIYVRLSKWPTSTKPGLMLRKRTPSFLYCALYLVTTTFKAALKAAYNVDDSISVCLMKSRSA